MYFLYTKWYQVPCTGTLQHWLSGGSRPARIVFVRHVDNHSTLCRDECRITYLRPMKIRIFIPNNPLFIFLLLAKAQTPPSFILRRCCALQSFFVVLVVLVAVCCPCCPRCPVPYCLTTTKEGQYGP